SKVGECLGMPAAELMTAQDDCGVPTCYLPLRQMALLYARLASSDFIEIERVVRAMVHHPDLVAGEGRFDTELMRLTQGELVSKSGAEGIQCVGRMGEAQGLAIKVQDGAQRAKYAVAIHLLRQVGWISPAIAEDLSEQFSALSDTKRLEVSGELKIL
ncbi:MAG: asparaginase, partial [Synechococcales cyanobacterium RU_4_20]|nr:asparaginase [Synechococcales cyanobacterium RU_4_20]